MLSDSMRPEQSVGIRALPRGEAALVQDDTGAIENPDEDNEWSEWVAASRTRNWILEDPLLDWLAAHGRDRGFLPDDERAGYNPRADFRRFVLEQGIRFEAGVMRCLAERVRVTTIATSGRDSRSLELAQATVEAMRRGDPVIAQGVLRDASRRTYGIADLLMRSDALSDLFPGSIPEDQVAVGAPGIDQDRCHYRIVDVKFHSFALLKDGGVGGGSHSAPYQAQVWLYGAALGRIQGFTPAAAYLLGRNWAQGKERGTGCFERLARVDMTRAFDDRDGVSLGELAEAAVRWMRLVRAEGAQCAKIGHLTSSYGCQAALSSAAGSLVSG